jgi:hypothetical protein
MEGNPEPQKEEFSAEKRYEFLSKLGQENEGAFSELERSDILRLVGVPDALLVEEINSVSDVEKLSKAIEIGLVSVVDKYSWSFLPNRPVVFTTIGGQKVPFYRSSDGTGGNKDAGKWYAFFGVGHKGWIIKGGGTDHNSGYDNPVIKKVQNILDSSFNWDHNLDLQKGKLSDFHPLAINQSNLELYCPPNKIDEVLFNKENLDDYYFNNYDSKHREWIQTILNQMYEKYPVDFVKEIKQINDSKINELGYK